MRGAHERESLFLYLRRRLLTRPDAGATVEMSRSALEFELRKIAVLPPSPGRNMATSTAGAATNKYAGLPDIVGSVDC